jgi:ubiquinone/menaquinone biosynthesis C-methylase UbiE
MSIEENRQYWNSLTAYNEALTKMGFSTREPELTKFFSTRLNPNQRILDLGVGVGVVYKLLKNFISPTKYVGADISETMLKHCKENTKDEILLFLLTSSCLPFLENYFDVIICYSVFTHLDSPTGDSLLGEIQRVLKTGGKAYISIIEKEASGGDYKTFFIRKAGEFQKSLETRGFKIMSQIKISGEPQTLIEVEK